MTKVGKQSFVKAMLTLAFTSYSAALSTKSLIQKLSFSFAWHEVVMEK